MATFTSKLKLKKPVASDYFNIEDFNGNMDIVDGLVHITASGTTTAVKSNIGNTATSGSLSWRWKKYNDGTFEAHTVFPAGNWKCNEEINNDYQSGFVRVYFPAIGIAGIDNVQLTVRATSCRNWAIDATKATEISYSDIRLCSSLKETGSYDKRLFIELKGTWQ